MNNYFKCAVKVEWETEDGKTKYRRENYIVNALNPTEVEAKMGEELKGSDFEIVAIVVTNIIGIIS